MPCGLANPDLDDVHNHSGQQAERSTEDVEERQRHEGCAGVQVAVGFRQHVRRECRQSHLQNAGTVLYLFPRIYVAETGVAAFNMWKT